MASISTHLISLNQNIHSTFVGSPAPVVTAEEATPRFRTPSKNFVPREFHIEAQWKSEVGRNVVFNKAAGISPALALSKLQREKQS